MLTTNSLKSTLEKLDRGEADVAMGICRDDLFGAFEKQFHEHGIVADYLATAPLNITVSKEHPLASSDELSLDYLMSYPCYTSVGQDSPEDYVSFALTEFAPFIKQMIFCEPGEARISMVKTTNGFIVSTPFSNSELESHGLVGRAIPGASVRFFTLCYKERRQEELIDRYIKLLKEETRNYYR